MVGLRFDLTPAFCMIASWICLAQTDIFIHLRMQRGNMVEWGLPRQKIPGLWQDPTAVLRDPWAKLAQLVSWKFVQVWDCFLKGDSLFFLGN
jgi:hypothetical protein